MKGEEFRRRREAIGYKTRPQTAVSIGVQTVTVKGWEIDRSPVPSYAQRWLERMEHQNGKETAHRR